MVANACLLNITDSNIDINNGNVEFREYSTVHVLDSYLRYIFEPYLYFGA